MVKINRSQFILFGLLITLIACKAPKSLFSFEEAQRQAPTKVEFSNQSINAEAYLWDFGDGQRSTEAEPTHGYGSSGKYTIVLEAQKGGKKNISKQEIIIDAPEVCLIEISTPYGKMIAELSDATPGHRDNFVKLAEEGFYDNLLFHRVINGFMIQGGDPRSKGADNRTQLGSGGPGYQIPAEFVDTLIHTKGAIAAARTGDAVNPEKKSSGSQFYIVQGKPVDDGTLNAMENRKGIKYSSEARSTYSEMGGTPFLDADYTVFGRIIQGLEVIDKIAEVETNRYDRPTEDVWMKVRVIK